MYTYNTTEWLAFFLIYSFLGWVWECCYVSVQKKKWVNRGFLKGPLLPIYGSGAVIVLWAALPFKENVIEVYLAGMIAATILEYCTGAAMEAIFKVRYWDYSDKKFNLNGHICLFCSLGWGLFSIAMVYCLHKPFERMVLSIPEQILSPAVHICMMVASADYGISFKTAIELRDILIKLENARKEAKILQKRLEVYEAFLADDLMQKKEHIIENQKELAELLREMGEAKSEAIFDRINNEKQEVLEKLSRLSELMEEKLIVRKDIRNLLRRNPNAISKRYKDTLHEIKGNLHKFIEKASK